MHDSPLDLIGNPPNSVSNPADVVNPSPGWIPDGATTDIPIIDARFSSSQYTSIIADLPAVNLSCSSDVKISVSSGSADLISAQTFNADYGWIVVNNLNRPIVFNNDYVQYRPGNSDNTPGPRSLIADVSLNPSAVAFGLKIIVSVEIYSGDGSLTNQWDVNDLQVQYTYDDEGGTCNSTPASVPVSCSDDYLDTQAVDVDSTELSSLGLLDPSSTFLNLAGGPGAATSDAGVTLNAGLNESGSDPIFRVFELRFQTQAPLLNAGDVVLTASYDLELGPNGGQVLIAISNLTTQYDWQQYNFALFSGTESVYLPSSELSEAHIYFMIPTFDGDNEQSSLTLSNLSLTVRHLQDIEVCGIQATNNSGTPTTFPSGVAAANAGTSSLPATGSPSMLLALVAVFLIGIGYFLLALGNSRRLSKAPFCL